jgi:malate dehydrogenase (oxaloacetate-decarboxylating)(NADP+)
VNPCAEDLVNITDLVAKAVRRLKLTPRIAMLGYSNFGSSPGEEPNKMRDAVEMLHQTQPNLIVDGEVQANFALNNEMLLEKFNFSTLANKQVNTLIFPNLSAGNIAYKMMQEMTDAEVVGPMLLGLKKSAHVLQLGCSVREIVNMVKIAVVDAQSKQ